MSTCARAQRWPTCALLLAAAIIGGGCPGPATADARLALDDHVRGEALVQFKPGTSPERVQAILEELGLARGRSLGTPLAFVVTFAADRSVAEVVVQLRALLEVEHAEPNRITPLPAPPGGRQGRPAGPR